jgi:hypothetical protein
MTQQLVMFDNIEAVAPRKPTAPKAPQPSSLGVDPVGQAEIADRLGENRQTVAQWHYRGLLPPARWTVGGRPAWNWADIVRWERAGGRPGRREGETTTGAGGRREGRRR